MDFPNPLDGIKSAGAAIQGFAGNAANAANEAALQIGGAANDLASQIGDAAGEAASQAGKAAGDALSQAGKATGEALSQASKAAGDAAGAISDGIENAKRDFEKKKSMNFQSIEALQPVVNVVNAALATAGALVGGGMAAGVFVLAAPVAIGAGVGIGLAAKLKADQLKQEKERLYKEALRKHQTIIQALKDEADASKERLDYLQSLNVLLTKAVNDLRADLDK